MQLSVYLRAIRKSWWLVALLTAAGVGLGIVDTALATPVYATTLSIYISVNPTSNTTGTNQLSDDQLAERRANSYVVLLSSERMAKIVIADAGLALSPAQVMGEISAAAQPNTVLLDATVKDVEPQRGLAIATSIANRFPAFAADLDNRGGQSAVVLNVVSGPTLHHTPVSPRNTLDVGLGLIVGLLLGIIAAVVRDIRDTTFGSVEQLRQIGGRPVLGEVVFDNEAKNAPLLVGEQLRSTRAEAYRQVRTNLQFADVDNPPRVILVTSSTPEEGKSTTSVNLALLFAESGQDVLLVEADLRRPQATAYFGLEQGLGLTDVLAGRVALEEALQEWGPRVTLLPGGSVPPNPSELLGSRNMGVLLTTMREWFDIVIIDTPPLGPVTDAAVMAPLADGVVVVVRHGETTRAQLHDSLQALDAVDARVFGLLLNMSKARSRGRDNYYNYQAPR